MVAHKPRFGMSDHPVCAASVASHHFLTGAATPPSKGGEYALAKTICRQSMCSLFFIRAAEQRRNWRWPLRWEPCKHERTFVCADYRTPVKNLLRVTKPSCACGASTSLPQRPMHSGRMQSSLGCTGRFAAPPSTRAAPQTTAEKSPWTHEHLKTQSSRRRLLQWRCHVPLISPSIRDAAIAIAIRLVLWRMN